MAWQGHIAHSARSSYALDAIVYTVLDELSQVSPSVVRRQISRQPESWNIVWSLPAVNPNKMTNDGERTPEPTLRGYVASCKSGPLQPILD